ncbi:MAG: hypothetical protein OEM05_18590 [Myxococcales bacterium]|nr:hypothetical protein [Myxococcales bacterium]
MRISPHRVVVALLPACAFFPAAGSGDERPHRLAGDPRVLGPGQEPPPPGGLLHPHLVVYRIPEPDLLAAARSVRADLALPFRCADQKGFPQWRRWNFDAEALFWMDGAPYILTKHRSDRRTPLYRLPVTPAPDATVFEPIAHFELGAPRCPYFSSTGNVTSADLHANGRVLAVLTYRAVFLFARDTDGDASFRSTRRSELESRRTRMAESVTWDGDDVIFGNEQRYRFRIPDPLVDEIDRYPPQARATARRSEENANRLAACSRRHHAPPHPHRTGRGNTRQCSVSAGPGGNPRPDARAALGGSSAAR